MQIEGHTTPVYGVKQFTVWGVSRFAYSYNLDFLMSVVLCWCKFEHILTALTVTFCSEFNLLVIVVIASGYSMYYSWDNRKSWKIWNIKSSPLWIFNNDPFHAWKKYSRIKSIMGDDKLTPAQQIIPHKALLLCKYSHDDECVEIDPLTQHPKVHTAQNVQVDKHTHLTTHLGAKTYTQETDTSKQLCYRENSRYKYTLSWILFKEWIDNEVTDECSVTAKCKRLHSPWFLSLKKENMLRLYNLNVKKTILAAEEMTTSQNTV